ncbi:TKL family protein kinase [Histomonas meleagridis]|uniref:TKL family protein kinase n=1 Tax=Histomonas meleagridis TaxID=135588 RepID=UPI003559F063|nr:TKL family protein kinase [Histomonas meleagridis]KAH0801781.1 TKL family protein kinase [Histomonas meleagridis]
MSSNNRTMPKNIYDLARMFPSFVRDANDFKCDKQIGKGGFGVVWVGTDTKTGQRVAVKEILGKALEGNNLTSYIREIYTLLITNHPFIVHMVGFSIDRPYSIITKYMGGGSLRDLVYFQSNRTRRQVSPTHLTCIMLCIASAMEEIHDKGLIHRDLKSSNILLDEKLLPRIIDFGIARTCSSRMSMRCGTRVYMAPEVASGHVYDNKADVYSFGLVVYEMCEGLPPFRNYDSEGFFDQLISATCILEYSKNTPKELKKLIEQCTNFKPYDRPSFSEIVEMIVSGKVVFPKTDKKKVQKMYQKIKAEMEKRSGIQKVNSETYIDVESLIQRLQEDSSEGKTLSPSGSSQTLFIEKLSDPHYNKYKETVKNLYSQLDQKDSKRSELLRALVKATQDETATYNQLEFIVKYIRKILKKYPEEIPEIVKLNFYQHMPLTTPILKSEGLKLFTQLLHKFKDVISSSYSPQIRKLIEYNPRAMLYLLYSIIKDPPVFKEEFCRIINEYYLQSDMYLKSNLSSQYIIIMYYVVVNVEEFIDYTSKDVFNLFIKNINHNNQQTSKMAIRSLSYLYQNYFNIDYENLLMKLSNPLLKNDIISLLLQAQISKGSPRIAAALVELAKESQKGFHILMNYVDLNESNAMSLLSVNDWMIYPLPKISNNFKLILLIVLYPQVRATIPQLNNLPKLLDLLIQSNNVFILSSMTTLLRRLKLTPQTINMMKLNGFFPKYFDAVNKINDVYLYENALILIDYLSRIANAPEMLSFIPIIKHVLRKYPNLTIFAVTLVVVMSAWPENRQTLKNEFGNYFLELMKYPQYAQYGKKFFKNVGG